MNDNFYGWAAVIALVLFGHPFLGVMLAFFILMAS